MPRADRWRPVPVRRRLADELLPPGRIESFDHRRLRLPRRSAAAALPQAAATVGQPPGFNANCDPATFTGCVPFGDMDANYSNGSSIYHGFTANLRKRFSSHYEFLASYTWSHAIDDSTDLQSTLTPQDSYYPAVDRSTSLFDQRHRFVFSGVYQTGKVAAVASAASSSATGRSLPWSKLPPDALQHHHRQRGQPAVVFAHRPSEHHGRSRLRHRLSIQVLAQRKAPGALHQQLRR